MVHLVMLIDTNAPLAEVQRELVSFQRWAAEVGTGVVLEVLAIGERASWLPEGVSLSSSAVSGVRSEREPNLANALDLVASRDADAVLTVLAKEPRPGWHAHARALPDFRAVVGFGQPPPGALGQGALGAPFIGSHLALALRWLTCEFEDRSWVCACGVRRVLGVTAACSVCGATELPRVLDLAGRQLVLAPAARIHAHHLGKPLAFDAPPRVLDDTTPAGPVTIDGVNGVVRPAEPRPRKGPMEAAIAGSARCAGCDGPLIEPVRREPPDPRRFCATCVASSFRCDFCGVPVGEGGGSRWPDGRKACPVCWSSAVTDLRILDELVDRATGWMRRTLGMAVERCPVRFEHAAAICELNGLRFVPQPGLSPRPIGFYVPTAAGGPIICVEHGSPRAIAYGVVAHELTHAWQEVHWPRQVPRTLVEGLAMWVEYQALLAAGAIHAARHAERYGDPVYGLGFRIALAVEGERGPDFVKHRLHELTQWPAQG